MCPMCTLGCGRAFTPSSMTQKSKFYPQDNKKKKGRLICHRPNSKILLWSDASWMFLVLFSSFWTHSNCGFSWKPHESLFGLGVRLWLRWTRWSHSSESLRDFTGAKGQSTPFFGGGDGMAIPASTGNPYNQCINPHSDWMDDRGHMSINDSCEKTSKSLTIWPQQQPAASLSIVPRPAAGTRGSSASLCDSSNGPSWYHVRTTWGLQMRKFWKNDSCQAVQRGNVATWQPWT